jgi:hypothetical protein
MKLSARISRLGWNLALPSATIGFHADAMKRAFVCDGSDIKKAAPSFSGRLDFVDELCARGADS